ncbi:Adhesion G-Protein Coupled Receptor V1 [Manis pentadactyla]|nr:Adhesion G-Protein Coupled Receptor V1 [Manis pentadactyla]
MENPLPHNGFPGMKTVTIRRSPLSSGHHQDSWDELSDVQDPGELGCSVIFVPIRLTSTEKSKTCYLELQPGREANGERPDESDVLARGLLKNRKRTR